MSETFTPSKREVYVTTSFIGFHRWPEAPKQVEYLRLTHRHNFVIGVYVSVSHSDRDVEFHILKAELDGYCTLLKNNFEAEENNESSCEHIAESIHKNLTNRGYKVTKVTVSEDGENGAVLYWE